jgi:hypothetical protein
MTQSSNASRISFWQVYDAEILICTLTNNPDTLYEKHDVKCNPAFAPFKNVTLIYE